MKPKYIAIIVLAVLAAVLVFCYVRKNRPEPNVFTPNKQETQGEQSLGAQVYEQSQNPIQDKVPETNPFKENTSNPIKESYTNPFE